MSKKYTVKIWYRYNADEKDFEFHDVEASDENSAKRKALDLYRRRSVIPCSAEIVIKDEQSV